MSIIRKVRALFRAQRRPIYGDVHVHITGDGAPFADAIRRTKADVQARLSALDGIKRGDDQ